MHTLFECASYSTFCKIEGLQVSIKSLQIVTPGRWCPLFCRRRLVAPDPDLYNISESLPRMMSISLTFMSSTEARGAVTCSFCGRLQKLQAHKRAQYTLGLIAVHCCAWSNWASKITNSGKIAILLASLACSVPWSLFTKEENQETHRKQILYGNHGPCQVDMVADLLMLSLLKHAL